MNSSLKHQFTRTIYQAGLRGRRVANRCDRHRL